MRLILLLTSLNLFASVGEKPAIEQCINLSAGKLVVPNNASFPTYQTCPNTNCLTLPDGFSCIYYKIEPQSTVTTCTNIPPEPVNGSPTEPLPPPVPMCESIQCPTGQTRSATDTAVTCSWQALELDPAKESAYNAQKAAAESTSAVYQESQLVANLNNYCLYVYQASCSAIPPASRQSTANSLSSILGKTPQQLKKLMEKKK